MSQVDSRIEITETNESVYVFNEPESWGQPSIERYELVVDGGRMYGQLIAGTYISSGSGIAHSKKFRQLQESSTSLEDLADLQVMLEVEEEYRAGKGCSFSEIVAELRSEA
jgi:hypothetical protein